MDETNRADHPSKAMGPCAESEAPRNDIARNQALFQIALSIASILKAQTSRRERCKIRAFVENILEN